MTHILETPITVDSKGALIENQNIISNIFSDLGLVLGPSLRKRRSSKGIADIAHNDSVCRKLGTNFSDGLLSEGLTTAYVCINESLDVVHCFGENVGDGAGDICFAAYIGLSFCHEVDGSRACVCGDFRGLCC